ncbi:MAG: amidohydrolase family protein [Bacteroidetes bacterium]|nr:amidohydrolase family protein [Bacteroidota bacterium]
MRKIRADSLFDGERVWRDTCLVMDDAGKVLALEPADRHPDARRVSGTLCPGFVNSHCHLELSHMAGSIPQGTGMAAFAGHIIRQRDEQNAEAQQEAARLAMDAAYAAGTVAMGDISNSTWTAELKRTHPLYTHTFIELLGARAGTAAEAWQRGIQTLQAFEGLPASLAPHAPYSVSLPLQQRIAAEAERSGGLWSMHFLESLQELEWLTEGTGPLAALLEPFGAASPLMDPVQLLLEYLPQHQRALLVHCTACAYPQLAALAPLDQLYFGLCPRSNVYIHEEEPYYALFPWDAGRVCLGTDSLASNIDLSLWNEVAFLKYKVPVINALCAATSSGAAFLGLDWAGAIRAGKSPGIVHFDRDLFSSEEIELTEPVSPILLIPPKH